MNAQLKITGIKELIAALQQLPPDLVREAAGIVQASAEGTAREAAGAYPSRSGELRNGLRIIPAGTTAGSATARVVNVARYAYVYERGTGGRKRQWANGKNTGPMPAGKIFIPIAMQRRRLMLGALIDLVERSGLHVSGAAV